MIKITSSPKFYSVNEARLLAKKRVPRLFFDFVDGSSGNETLNFLNTNELQNIRLMPRVLQNVHKRTFKTKIFDINTDYPFGFAPMGMCNLTWPNADKMLAYESKFNNIPFCLSMAASSTLEEVFDNTEGRSWFQIYVGQDEDYVMEMVERAQNIGYKVLILTVDVPVLANRVRDERNGWNVPFKIGLKQFLDFMFHPNWSIQSLINGIPKPMNYETSKTKKGFVRGESRGSADWKTLEKLRNVWKNKLIVKGVMSTDDALKIKNLGVDAIYISNHGGRQLESAPTSINVLPSIRETVGNTFPLIIDSGIRSGDDIIKALAIGANFVMIGRPLLYGIGADGSRGLKKILEIFKNEISTTLGLVGLNDIKDISSEILYRHKG